ncbi:MAG TPA: flagellar motor switch protein FliG [Longimicrobiales bacterium]|nr:flagellar motor switch protein FliG [Longimicrobiales bacterium]
MVKSVFGRPMRVEDLTGRQKVAVLCMALGPEAAAKLTQHMEPEELEEITLEIARLEHVPVDVAEAVLEEWEKTEQAAHSLTQGGVEYARQLLEQVLGPQKAAVVLKRIESQLQDSGGFRTLREADPQQLGSLLRNEHPQTVALILAHLGSAQAAEVIKELPTDLGAEVLYRMARLEKVLPEILEVVERSMGNEAGLAMSRDMSSVGGPAAVAEVLNQVAGPIEAELLSGIAQHSSELCDQIKNLMFVFEDLIKLDDRSLQRVLREVESKEIALALKTASDELKSRILSIMSKRAVEALKEEMELLGPVRVRDVMTAQAAIVKAVRDLEEAGEIVIGGGVDDLVVH